MKFCKPFYNASTFNISQRFGENPQIYGALGHQAIDFFPFNASVATMLVAPEDVRIVKLVDGRKLDPSLAPLERGYGVLMQSIAFPDMYHVYWHCSAVFPVEEGDIIKQGKIVAQMSNSGFVMSRGQIIPLDIRSIPPYRGTHLHWEHYILLNGVKTYLDPLNNLDWDIKVEGSPLDAIANILKKITSLFK
ncbi:MAG: M23 family metallopeptidase [Saprospiraceae bacterium]|nr:M23 family metallopeptidase [Saprospiraceae bacterium]